MQDPLIITFRHLESSEAVENQIRQRLSDLQKLYPRIVACEVVIEAPQKRKVTGREFKVHLKLSIPGPDINVTGEASRGEAAEDVNVAVREAFDAAERILMERKEKLAGH